MNECCTLDNLEAATASGSLSSKVNCLTCKTCKEQQTFTYLDENEMNLCWSYVRFGIARRDNYLAVFRNAGGTMTHENSSQSQETP